MHTSFGRLMDQFKFLDKCRFLVAQVKIKFLSVKLLTFSYPSVITYVLGAQKTRLIETVLLSTHNKCFGCKIRKLIFCYNY